LEKNGKTLDIKFYFILKTHQIFLNFYYKNILKENYRLKLIIKIIKIIKITINKNPPSTNPATAYSSYHVTNTHLA